MSTFRSTLARFAMPLIGVYLLLIGLGLVFGLAVPALLLGIVALFAGICALCAS
jgi:hypothetical protein